MIVNIVIDGNNLLKAGYKKDDPNRWHMVGYFFSRLADIKKNFPNGNVIVLWDSKTNWRYSYAKDYKENRKVSSSPETDLKKEKVRLDKIAMRQLQNENRAAIRKIISYLPIYSFEFDDYEADDLAYLVVSGELYNFNNNPIRLITADKDWLQLVQDGVTWQNTRSPFNVVSLANFETYTGYKTPKLFLESKLLQGDSGDNVKGVEGFGETYTKKFLETYKSIDGYYKIEPGYRLDIWNGRKPKGFNYLELFENADEALHTQRVLMDLSTPYRKRLYYKYQYPLPVLVSDFLKVKEAFRKCGLIDLYLQFNFFEGIFNNGIS